MKVQIWDKLQAVEEIIGAELDCTDDLIDRYVIACDIPEDALGFGDDDMLRCLGAMFEGDVDVDEEEDDDE